VAKEDTQLAAWAQRSAVTQISTNQRYKTPINSLISLHIAQFNPVRQHQFFITSAKALCAQGT
jgi:hypothetical protein